MLLWLNIKNLALIESETVEFQKGLNILTGETGAGKSVLTGAISLILGSRADKSMIRSGTTKCEISAVFLLQDKIADEIQIILQENEIDVLRNSKNELELQIRRVITPTSSRQFINDSSVTTQFLNHLAEWIVDVHAANEHYSLSNNAVQLNLLDRFGNLEKHVEECTHLYKKIRQIQHDRSALLEETPNALESEHLKHIIQEISQANIGQNEEEQVGQQYTIVANAQEIIKSTSQSLDILQNESTGIRTQWIELHRQIEHLQHLDQTSGEDFLQRVNEIFEQINEINNDLERYLGRIEVDDQKLIELDTRLSTIQKIKRRYGPSWETIQQTLQEAMHRIEMFENSESLLKEWDEMENKFSSQLKEKCQELHHLRKKIAVQFSQAATTKLNHLGFLKSVFDIEFKEVDPGAKGSDRIEFLFSANPGEPGGPLDHFASSGELSRVMLAIKSCLAQTDAIPVLLFDEIDVNIGGETATIIGEELKNLAQNRQIICISHLPQVAAFAEHHFRVFKETKEERTLTHIEDLEYTQRIAEIARMLGNSNAAMKHAKELLNSIQKKKNELKS